MKAAQAVEFQRLAGVITVDNLNIRVTFSKTDRAKYISHLDLNRTMQRAIKRAGIPVWYTKGFNPHAYIMFPLALSLGFDSKCELMDFTLTSPMDFDEIKDKLNDALPDGLKVSRVSEQVKKHTEIEKSEFRLIVKTDVTAEIALAKFNEFLGREKIEIEKATKKKGINLVDIKLMIKLVEIKIEEDYLIIIVVLPAGTQTNINPMLVTEAFSKLMGIDISSQKIERTKILCEDDNYFI